jgi:hypothetical protein
VSGDIFQAWTYSDIEFGASSNKVYVILGKTSPPITWGSTYYTGYYYELTTHNVALF